MSTPGGMRKLVRTLEKSSILHIVHKIMSYDEKQSSQKNILRITLSLHDCIVYLFKLFNLSCCGNERLSVPCPASLSFAAKRRTQVENTLETEFILKARMKFFVGGVSAVQNLQTFGRALSPTVSLSSHSPCTYLTRPR